MDNFTPGSALFGGVLIGAAASLFMLTTGRVAGISGIVGGLLRPRPGDVLWRVAFVAGLLLVGALAAWFAPASVAFGEARSLSMVAAAGALVGVGTRLGSGCTSGHGVCGISRLSARSIVATLTFMATGIGTVALLGAQGGGG